MMEKDPNVLNKYTKEQLINYMILSNLSRKEKEVLETLKAGVYNTRYALCKFHKTNAVQRFIRHGMAYGFLKKEWIYVGARRKAILKLTLPSENLDIKAQEEPITQPR